MADLNTLGTGECQSLESKNPLVERGCWNGDTANNVRSALEFLAVALPAITQDAGFTDDTAHGAYLLLRACAEAVQA